MSDDGFTKEEIQAEIKDAVRILREDGVMAHLKGISEKLAKAFPDGNDDNGNDNDDGSGKPPPKTDPKPSADQTASKRSRWWGDQL